MKPCFIGGLDYVMKSVILHEVVDKKYFLGFWYHWGYKKLSVDSELEDEGRIANDISHVSWNIELETKDFTRELRKNELIHIEGKDYYIVKVAHSDEGKILYYIDKKVFIEDLESKEKAERDLEARKFILADRKKQQESKYASDEYKCRNKKKWYQKLFK